MDGRFVLRNLYQNSITYKDMKKCVKITVRAREPYFKRDLFIFI